ncbi:uncharacterized protein LOC131631803 [Vicia villosa]|uniref:uncharacterized protein LOC131631803 n=1 Tax=Vicia villosa TaxID=3911 RepID=UPI00273AB857|nr:uncharacterized protein LOC131631803 [Vicia villosa]
MDLIEQTKICFVEMLRLNNIEEHMLKQKAKVKWPKLGDGNNKYFYATLKNKTKPRNIVSLVKDNGSTTQNQIEFKDEISNYYNKIIVTSSLNRKGINIVDMRKWNQISTAQGQMLMAPISEDEVKIALKRINDNNAPGIVGFGAKIFKST